MHVRWNDKKIRAVFLLIVVGVLTGRLFFVWHQPFTVDEGAYLYDARTILTGKVPGGDALVKSPVVVAIFSIGVYLTRYSLFAARIMQWVAVVPTTLALMFLGTTLYGRRAGYIAGALWLAGAGTIAFLTPAQTEFFAGTFSLMALTAAVGLSAAARDLAAWRRRLYAMLCGGAFFLALASRKTSLAVLPPLVLVLLMGQRREAFKVSWLWLTLGFWLPAVATSLGLWLLYGNAGILQFWGLGYATLISEHVQGAPIHSDGGGLIWIFSILARLGGWNAVGLLVGYGWLIAILARKTRVPLEWVGWFMAAGAALLLGVLQKTQQMYTLGSLTALTWFLWAGLFCAAALHAWHYSGRLTAIAVPGLWFFSLLGLYSMWPSFLADYAGDFLLPSTLLTAAALAYMSRSRRFIVVGGTLLVLSNLAALSNLYTHPFPAYYNRESIKQAAELMRDRVPLDELVFTGAVIIPYVSGHHVLGDIAHPLWYRYAFVQQDTKHVFLPELETVEDAVRNGQVRWALIDQLTDYAYLRNASRLVKLFDSQWESAGEVQNRTDFRSNTLKLKHFESR